MSSRHWCASSVAGPSRHRAATRVPAGHVMTVQSVCLGWHWYPYVYSRTADDTDGAPVKPMPDDVVALASGPSPRLWHGRRRRAPRRMRRSSTSMPPGLTSACIRTGGASCGARRHDQPRRHVRVPDGGGPPHVTVHRRPGERRPARVRRAESPHLPRRAEGARRHGTGRLGLPPGRLSITVRETGLA